MPAVVKEMTLVTEATVVVTSGRGVQTNADNATLGRGDRQVDGSDGDGGGRGRDVRQSGAGSLLQTKRRWQT